MIDLRPIKIECPKCKECTLPILRRNTVCTNCGKRYKWHELKRKWQKAFISSGNGVKLHPNELFESCVECLNPSMIFYKKLGIWVCFSCGSGWEKHELSQCEACGRFTDNPKAKLCWSCWVEGVGRPMVIPEFDQISNRVGS